MSGLCMEDETGKPWNSCFEDATLTCCYPSCIDRETLFIDDYCFKHALRMFLKLKHSGRDGEWRLVKEQSQRANYVAHPVM